MPPMRRISLHSHRRVYCHECPSSPLPREWSLRTPCTCRVASTTCCTRLHRQSCDSRRSYVRLHWPEWGTVVGIGCHRNPGWALCVRWRTVCAACTPRMSVVGTSRYGSRSNQRIQNHFPLSLVPLRHFGTTSGTPRSTHRCDLDERCGGVPIDHLWGWGSWSLHHVSTWGCMPWWWWNIDCIHAYHWWWTFSRLHWIHLSHRIWDWSVPLPHRSSHPVVEPTVCCQNRCWDGSPSWCASPSPTPCTCLLARCDSTWVHIQVTSRSHHSIVPVIPCDRSVRMPYCVSFHVSSPRCSGNRVSDVVACHRIHVHSTHTRGTARSMPCFPRRDTCARLWDHWRVYVSLVF